MARFSIQNITRIVDNRDLYIEPVTVDELKDYLQLGPGTAYDTVLQGFITAARQMIENYSNVSLVPKEIWAQIRNMSDRAFPLPLPPIDSVETVIFKKCRSTAEELTFDEDWYFNNEYAADKWIVAKRTCTQLQFFMVHYYTLGNENQVWKQAIKAQAGYMFNNRDSVLKNQMAPETEALIQAFSNKYF